MSQPWNRMPTKVNKPIRILIVIDELEFGGSERQILELVKGLDPGRYQAIVCCLTRVLEMLPEFEREGIKVLVVEKKYKLDFSVIRRLAKVIKDERIDIVHTFLFTGDTWGRLGAIKAGISGIISSTRNVDTWKKWYHWQLDRFLSLFTNAIVTNSKMTKQYLVSKGHLPEKKIRIIHNGLDMKRFSRNGGHRIKDKLEIPSHHRVVGTVCRLVQQKNVHFLIEVASQVLKQDTQVVFIIIGDGPLKNDLEGMTYQLGLNKHFRFLGARDDVQDLLDFFDVFVLTSHREGLSNAVMEAMAKALPVVVTRVGGNSELVNHGRNGFLVTEGDRDTFCAYLKKLLGDSELSRSMGKESQKIISKYFTADRMVKETQQVYETCLNAG